MSTICKIVVASSADGVVAAIREFLSADEKVFSEESSEWPKSNDAGVFKVGEEFPTVLSVKEVIEGFVEIHFNSFSKLPDLASFLSKKLEAVLVVNIYQSTATASYWAYYLRGECLREIEAGDGEVYSQRGLALAFEEDEPGHDISEEGEEPMFVFDDQDQSEYNERVEIPLEVYQDYGSGWENFLVEPSAQVLQGEKPWWKFW